MERRDVDEILLGTLPNNSQELYSKRWGEFIIFIGEQRNPEETDFLQYFNSLRNNKKYKASTLWTIYSMLNSVYQKYYGKKLQNWPRITQLLKSYNDGYERKVASVFRMKDINDYLNIDDSSPFILVRKAIIAIAISGGLRTAEVRDLSFSDVVQNEETYTVKLLRKKQRGEKKKSSFIVPASFSSHIKNYLLAVSAVLPELSGPLIKGTPTNKDNISRFVNQPMGINKLYSIGKDVALKLQLDNSESYTGHCFRRTSATIAADSGATAQQMQRAFGWKSASTAQKYVEESTAGARAMASFYSSSTEITTFVKEKSGEKTSKVFHVHGAPGSTYNFY